MINSDVTIRMVRFVVFIFAARGFKMQHDYLSTFGVYIADIFYSVFLTFLKY